MRQFVIATTVLIFGCLSSNIMAQENATEAAVKLVGRDGETVSMTVKEFSGLSRTEVEAKDRDGTMAKFSGVEVSTLLTKIGAAQGESCAGNGCVRLCQLMPQMAIGSSSRWLNLIQRLLTEN